MSTAHRLAFLLLFLLLPISHAAAHPGVGIVMDGRGNVFYTDLFRVWRITPDGRKSVVVPDVHAHELSIDSAGNVFGEDSKYIGDDKWRHRVWRRSPDGRVTDVVPWTDGFWRAYGFVHDAAGAMYWVRCPDRVCTIRKRTASGRVSDVAPGTRYSENINWIARGPAGSLYVIDGKDLKRLGTDGRLTTVVRSLGAMIMGLFTDARDNLYVAVWGDRSVLKVTPAGAVTTVVRVAEPWGPSGVLIARDGSTWLLETSKSNEVRVRRIAADGRVTSF